MIPIKSMFRTTIFWIFVFFGFFSFLRFRVNPALTDKIFGVEPGLGSEINVEELSTKLDAVSLSISNMESNINDNKSKLDEIIEYIKEEKIKEVKDAENVDTDNNLSKKKKQDEKEKEKEKEEEKESEKNQVKTGSVVDTGDQSE